MKPLSRRKRIIYLCIFALLFFISIPFAILYANGYNFNNFALVSTGGVYVSVPTSGATVSVNGVDEGTTSLFTRGFYVHNLAPGSYAIHVAKEGSFPWYRALVVEPGIVTDAHALLIPQQIEPVRLVRSTTASTTSSTTKAVLPQQYDAYLTLFAAPKVLSKSLAGTTTSAPVGPLPDDVQSGFKLYISNGSVQVRWAESTSTIPSNFCSKPELCVWTVDIRQGKESITYARFWSGGVVYTTSSGVYLTEVDVRPTPLVVPLYPRVGSVFRVADDGSLLVKDGSALYQINPF